VPGIAACRFTLIVECSYSSMWPPDEREHRDDLQCYAAEGDDAATSVGNVK
jgi:hypothetical protein